jgi:hypothetical protein
MRVGLMFVVLGSLACAGAAPEPVPAPAPVPVAQGGPALEDPRTWPQATSVELGCMFERAGAPPEPQYRCGAPPAPPGDPCRETELYSAGPEFPSSLLSQMPKAVAEVRLSWMAGKLQSVTFTSRPGGQEARFRKVLRMDEPQPDNVMSADVQQCSKDKLCASFDGFEWQGAGEVDCGG